MKVFNIAADTPSILISVKDNGAVTQIPEAFFTRKDLTFERAELVYDAVSLHNDGVAVARRMARFGCNDQTINRAFNGERMVFIRDGYALLVSPSQVETA